MIKKIVLGVITASIVTTSSSALVVHDPIMQSFQSANWAKELKNMQEQYNLLSDTLSWNQGASYNVSVNAQKQIVTDYISKELGGGKLGKNVSDVASGCLEGFFKKIGGSFKLPNFDICGVNVVGQISDAIEDNVKEIMYDDVISSSNVLIKPTTNKPTKKDKETINENIDKETKKGEETIAEKDIPGGTEDGSGPINNYDNNMGIIEENPNTSKTTLYKNTKTQPTILEGTAYTSSQKQYANALYNKKLKQDALRKVDRAKESRNQKSVTNMFDEDIKSQIKENKKDNVLSDVPVIIPQLIGTDSSVTLHGRQSLLSSGNYGKYNVISTKEFMTTGSDLISNPRAWKKLKLFNDRYKKLTGLNLGLTDKDAVFNYAKMAELNLRSTLLAVGSIKGDTDKGKTLATMEYLKGILVQLYILNAQMNTIYDKQAKNETMRYNRLQDKIDNMDTALDMLLHQNSEYSKAMLENK